MKALQLPEKKEFMHRLLCSPLFDNFLLSEASIHAAVTYEIDGTLNPDFYSAQERSDQHLDGLAYMPYGRLRPVFYSLIRGRNTPSYFKFVLMLSPENLHNTIQASGTSVTVSDISAVFVNIRFQNGQLLLTTGVSYRNFIPEKGFEREWDRLTMHFLKKNNIIFSEI
ncbi:MAG: hypothetical protein HFH35_03405 [Eubacterium sp.]|nr:hypothetical protein [Eubacterium sp.]